MHPLPPPDPPKKKKPQPSEPTPIVIPGLPDVTPPYDPGVEMNHLCKWTLGSGDHCDECYALSGQVKTLAEWYRLNLIPPIHMHCKCSLIPVEQENLSMPNSQPLQSVQSVPNPLTNPRTAPNFRGFRRRHRRRIV